MALALGIQYSGTCASGHLVTSCVRQPPPQQAGDEATDGERPKVILDYLPTYKEF